MPVQVLHPNTDLVALEAPGLYTAVLLLSWRALQPTMGRTKGYMALQPIILATELFLALSLELSLCECQHQPQPGIITTAVSHGTRNYTTRLRGRSARIA